MSRRMLRASPPSARRVGDGVHLTIDANQAYSVKDAITALNRMAEYDIDLAEQPVARRRFCGTEARHQFGADDG